MTAVAARLTVLARRTRRRELRSRLAGEEAERRRWAQELHDDTLQELAAVQVLLSAARTDIDTVARSQAIEQAQDCVARQIAALRRLIDHLRPLALDTLGLVPAVRELARRDPGPGTVIEAVLEPLPPLPAEVETAAYRIVQEAVTNALRHAGASRITIAARAMPNSVLVTVADNGGGGDRIAPGFGLLGMRERAEAIGAQLAFIEDHGLTVRLDIPLPESRQYGVEVNRAVPRWAHPRALG
jgi:signal transduction histidine kinase